MRLNTRDQNTIAVAALRISVGTLFLIFGEYKVFDGGFTRGGGFQFWIDRFLAGGAYPFMVPVLEKFVLPHATSIAFFVAYGELAIGLALVLGVVVRPVSICGAVYMLTLLFSSNYPGAQAPVWEYFGASLDHSVLALCFGAFVIGEADGALSVRNYWRWIATERKVSAARSSPGSGFSERKDVADARFQGGDHE
jgi:thiosulfate dehydrogenase [quinone] large subunit